MKKFDSASALLQKFFGAFVESQALLNAPKIFDDALQTSDLYLY